MVNNVWLTSDELTSAALFEVFPLDDSVQCCFLPMSECLFRAFPTTSPAFRHCTSWSWYWMHCCLVMYAQQHTPSFNASQRVQRCSTLVMVVGDWKGTPSGHPTRSIPYFSLIATSKLAKLIRIFFLATTPVRLHQIPLDLVKQHTRRPELRIRAHMHCMPSMELHSSMSAEVAYHY